MDESNKVTLNTGATSEVDEVKRSMPKFSKKIKIIIGSVVALVVILVAVVLILTRPISKAEAAEKMSNMLDNYNATLVDIKNDAKTLDIDKLRTDSEKMVRVLAENTTLAREVRWPEGLSKSEKRLSGETVSDMELYARDLEKESEIYRNMVNASDDQILDIYDDVWSLFGVINTDDFRTKLGLPSKVAEQNKYHELTDDEVTAKLQETALDVNLGKYYISCRQEQSYTYCDSGLDVTVRNKSKINLTDGGAVDVTAYDATGNLLNTETFYIGNRLEKGQTAKKKLFDYVQDEYREDLLNNPTFKVTKIQIYNF